jgi:hypothetical protein
MLQWLGPAANGQAVYNDVAAGRFVARIVDVEGRLPRAIPWPVYALHPSGGWSVSLQFERSYWCRAYHYESIRNPAWNVRVHPDDGLFRVNLATGAVRRIVSLAEILAIDPDPGFDSRNHWLEHIMANPSGTRFAFYHRFGRDEVFRTRVFTVDGDGGNLALTGGWREAQYSHLGWRNDDEFALFTYETAAVGRAHAALARQGGGAGLLLRGYRRLLRPLVPRRGAQACMQRTFYGRVRDRHGVVGRFDTGRLTQDGHPSFTPDGAWMLTDTYADDAGYRHLLLFDTHAETLLDLGRFHSPFNNCGYRCDLHPRFSRDATHVVIDTAHTGRHQMLVLRLDWDALRAARRRGTRAGRTA